jgi:isoleucyl-tRNA synthetase
MFEKWSHYKPLFDTHGSGRRLPIMFSSHVTPDSGTGAVHLAPAHGQEDYELFKKHGRTTDMLCHVDGHGQFTPSVAEVVGDELAVRLVGKEVLSDGSREVVEILRERGVLLKVQRYKHRYPYDWKTDKPIIMMSVYTIFSIALG